MKTPLKILATLLFALVGVWLALALTGCTFTIGSDGSKSFNVDGGQLIEIINSK